MEQITIIKLPYFVRQVFADSTSEFLVSLSLLITAVEVHLGVPTGGCPGASSPCGCFLFYLAHCVPDSLTEKADFSTPCNLFLLLPEMIVLPTIVQCRINPEQGRHSRVSHECFPTSFCTCYATVSVMKLAQSNDCHHLKPD